MQAYSGHAFLTFILTGAVAGFLVYCLSYVFHVWQARHFSDTPAEGRRLLRGGAALGIGLVTAAIGWADSDLRDRNGYIDVRDVFVLYGHRGAAVQSTTALDQVAQGTIIAEFDGPSERASLAMLDLHVEQARQRRDAAMLGAPQLDTGLLQEQGALRMHLLQLETLLQDIRGRQLQTEQLRSNATLAFQKSDAELEVETTLAGNDLADARSRSQLAERSLGRTDSLLRSGLATQAAHETHEREKSGAWLAVERHQQRMVLAARRRLSDATRFRALDERLAHEIDESAALFARYDAKRREAAARLDELDRTAGGDRLRAGLQRKAEASGLDMDMRALEAERSRLSDTIFVRAPFAGRVVYRHPAPQLAAERMPILALAGDDGFIVQVRLPAGEVEALKRAGDIRLTIEAPVLRQHLTARFLRAEIVKAEPDTMLAILQCEMVAEILPILANTQNRVSVHLDWSPPLAENWTFIAGMVIAVAGVLGMAWPRRPPPEPLRLITGPPPAMAEAAQPGPVLFRYLAFRFVHQLAAGLLDSDLLRRVEAEMETGGPAFSQELGRALLRQWPSLCMAELEQLADPSLVPDVRRLLARLVDSIEMSTSTQGKAA